MEVMHERVAGLDVHKDNVVACVRTMSDGKPTREIQTFAATTDGAWTLTPYGEPWSARVFLRQTRQRSVQRNCCGFY